MNSNNLWMATILSLGHYNPSDIIVSNDFKDNEKYRQHLETKI